MSWRIRVEKISKLLKFLMALCGVLVVYFAYAYALSASSAVGGLKDFFSSYFPQAVTDLFVGLLDDSGVVLFGVVLCMLVNCAFYALLAFSGNLDNFDSTGKIIAKLIFRVIFFVAVIIAFVKVADAFLADIPIVFSICLLLGLPILLTFRILFGLVKKAGKNTLREYVPSSGAGDLPVRDDESEQPVATNARSNVDKQISKNAYIGKDNVYVNCFHDGEYLRDIDESQFIVYLERFSNANAIRHGVAPVNLRSDRKIVDATGEICYYDGVWFIDAKGHRCTIKGRI